MERTFNCTVTFTGNMALSFSALHAPCGGGAGGGGPGAGGDEPTGPRWKRQPSARPMQQANHQTRSEHMQPESAEISSAGSSTGPAPEMTLLRMTTQLTVERDGLMLSGGGGRESSAYAKHQEADELRCGAHQHAMGVTLSQVDNEPSMSIDIQLASERPSSTPYL